jgi:hypothetical protein
MSAVDDAITRITEAPSEEAAKAIARVLSHRLLLAVADQLHIDTCQRNDQWVRSAIVKEARA